jgi:hypothetical protein
VKQYALELLGTDELQHQQGRLQRLARLPIGASSPYAGWTLDGLVGMIRQPCDGKNRGSTGGIRT